MGSGCGRCSQIDHGGTPRQIGHRCTWDHLRRAVRDGHGTRPRHRPHAATPACPSANHAGARARQRHGGGDDSRHARRGLHTQIVSSDIEESTPMVSALGATPRRTTADPSAAIMAPLSVQYFKGGMRTSMPRSAPRGLCQFTQLTVGRESAADHESAHLVAFARVECLRDQDVGDRRRERCRDVGHRYRTARVFARLDPASYSGLEAGEREVVGVALVDPWVPSARAGRRLRWDRPREPGDPRGARPGTADSRACRPCRRPPLRRRPGCGPSSVTSGGDVVNKQQRRVSARDHQRHRALGELAHGPIRRQRRGRSRD